MSILTAPELSSKFDSHGLRRAELVAPIVHIRITRGMLTILASLIGLPWVIVGALFFAWAANRSNLGQSAAAATGAAQGFSVAATSGSGSQLGAGDNVVLGNSGAWGRMSYSSLAIDLPQELVYVPPANSPPMHWFFQGFTKDKAMDLLRESGVSAAQFDMLARDGKWFDDPAGVALEPGDGFILSLEAEVRGKIYNTLVEFPQNEHQIDPIWMRPSSIDWRMEDSGLAPESLALVKRLLYPQGPTLSLFADFEPALRRMPSDAERVRLMSAVSRKKTLLAGLIIDSTADVERLADYWGTNGRRKDVLPLLHAIHREKRPSSKVNIVCLLPAFARDHLYRHPTMEVESKGVLQDCFWSAMNFFNDVPNNQFNDMKYLRDVLDRDYVKIMQPGQLGDLVFLTTANESVIHAANYVGDDIVFTKNGAAPTQPWILMREQDMIDTYAVRHPKSGPLQVRYFRLKTL